MKRYFIYLLLLCPVTAFSQQIGQVLRQIEQNNLQLQGGAQLSVAEKMENQTANQLSDPSVTYESFYSRKTEGGHASELSVEQEIDFPTTYITRRKHIALQNQVVDKAHQLLRRDILFQAQTLCLQLVQLNKQQALLNRRTQIANQVLSLTEQRLQSGDISLLEANKLRIEQINLKKAVAQNEADRHTLQQQLTALNGNIPVEITDTVYPAVTPIADYETLRQLVLSSDATLQVTQSALLAARKDVAVQKQGWLPKVSFGFRRNTNPEYAENGFLIGGSLPIFQNRRKVQIAKARMVSAQLQQDDVRNQVESTLKAQYHEMMRLRQAMETYDLPLITHTLQLLYQALQEGELSFVDYSIETEDIYDHLSDWIELEGQYHRLLADIFKNDL